MADHTWSGGVKAGHISAIVSGRTGRSIANVSQLFKSIAYELGTPIFFLWFNHPEHDNNEPHLISSATSLDMWYRNSVDPSQWMILGVRGDIDNWRSTGDVNPDYSNVLGYIPTLKAKSAQ